MAGVEFLSQWGALRCATLLCAAPLPIEAQGEVIMKRYSSKFYRRHIVRFAKPVCDPLEVAALVEAIMGMGYVVGKVALPDGVEIYWGRVSVRRRCRLKRRKV